MPERARRHHVVSKFYLRHFADKREQLATTELPGDRHFIQSVEDASVRRDYYTAIGHDGQATDAPERIFATLEGAAADAWRQIASGVWPLPTADREAAAGWMALQMLRADSVRTSMGNIGTDLLHLQIMIGGRERLREVLRDAGEEHDNDSVDREWVSLFRDPLYLEVHPNQHLQYIASVLPRLTSSLLDRWWLLTRFERRALATSDHPVVVLPNERDAALGLGTGFETADHLLVPVTRRASLSMARRDSLEAELARSRDSVQPGSTQVALFANSATARNARRFLFHHPDDSPLDGLQLPNRRSLEIAQDGDPWRFMRPGDRQLLLEAGVSPPSPHEHQISPSAEGPGSSPTE